MLYTKNTYLYETPDSPTMFFEIEIQSLPSITPSLISILTCLLHVQASYGSVRARAGIQRRTGENRFYWSIKYLRHLMSRYLPIRVYFILLFYFFPTLFSRAIHARSGSRHIIIIIVVGRLRLAAYRYLSLRARQRLQNKTVNIYVE